MRSLFEKGLKSELIVKYIAVIAITTLVSCFMGTLLINKWTIGQAQSRVRSAVDLAQEVIDNRLEMMKSSIAFTSSNEMLRKALITRDRAGLLRSLEAVKRERGFDILTIVDARGDVVLRTSHPGLFDDNISDDALVGQVLSSGKTVSSVYAMTAAAVRKEGAELASRCSDGSSLPDPAALALVAASPVLLDDGRVAGVLYGGEILNRNDEIVDKIRYIVYQNEKYRGKEMGGATLCLGDVRVATNFTNADGSRGIGSIVSAEVTRPVLREGKLWVGKIPVIHNGYVSAYKPIRNFKNDIIGLIGIAMLEQKFADMRTETLSIFLGISLFGVILSVVVANYFVDSIVKPVNALVRVSRRISEGDFSARVDRRSTYEIGALEETFNLMASSLQSRDKEIERLNEQRLMRSEKLASIGRLAAGIAHEINNPLTSVLTFSSLLLRKADGSQREKLAIVVKETTRCREIVKDLLNFAHQGEPKRESCDINRIVESALSVAKSQLQVRENLITVAKELTPVPLLQVDPNQMLEVFVHMIINAVDAMPKGGRLTIKTALALDGKWLEVAFADTGQGIAEEDLEKVFDPFFTTKEVGKGTGLGLAVTYGIIDGYNGSIDVESEKGKGATFVIRLPLGQA